MENKREIGFFETPIGRFTTFLRIKLNDFFTSHEPPYPPPPTISEEEKDRG